MSIEVLFNKLSFHFCRNGLYLYNLVNLDQFGLGPIRVGENPGKKENNVLTDLNPFHHSHSDVCTDICHFKHNLNKFKPN